MPVITAAGADLALVKTLVRDAARRQIGLGEEDLALLVAAGHVLLLVHDAPDDALNDAPDDALNDAPDGAPDGAESGAPDGAESGAQRAARDEWRPLAPGDVRALAAFYPEARPPSLPPAEPDRVFLRAAAFRGGTSPSAALAALVDAWCSAAAPRPRLLIAYGGEPWFNRSLHAAGCALAEEVIYFELGDLQRADLVGLAVGLAGGLAVGLAGEQESKAEAPRLAVPAELSELAALDAACFNVLWHMGVADLRQLLLFGRLTVAVRDGALVGYLALTIQDDTAQIARLAVHPAWSGRGIGRALLAEGLQTARALGCRRAVLNTQAANSRSQTLYHSLGFRPTGERFEVYTRLA